MERIIKVHSKNLALAFLLIGAVDVLCNLIGIETSGISAVVAGLWAAWKTGHEMKNA